MATPDCWPFGQRTLFIAMYNYIKKLYAHIFWADARVVESFLTLPDSGVRALEIFGHVLGAEHVWLARLRQQPASVPVWPTLSIEQCSTLALQNQQGYNQFIDSLDSHDFGREIAYTNSAGLTFRSTVEDILLHVALHGGYHRGQVALLVRSSGNTPAGTDYIAFVRGAPAATPEGPGSRS